MWRNIKLSLWSWKYGRTGHHRGEKVGILLNERGRRTFRGDRIVSSSHGLRKFASARASPTFACAQMRTHHEAPLLQRIGAGWLECCGDTYQSQGSAGQGEPVSLQPPSNRYSENGLALHSNKVTLHMNLGEPLARVLNLQLLPQ